MTDGRKKKIRLKKKYAGVKSKIDTGLSDLSKPRGEPHSRAERVREPALPERKPQGERERGSTRGLLTLPRLENILDIVKLSDEAIKHSKRYKKINNRILLNVGEPLHLLDEMVGMEELKKTVFDQIIYYLLGLNHMGNRDEYLHTIIVGPPGVGKTTVAKILAKIYLALGAVDEPRNIFKIAHREDMVASYLGQTATKTLSLLQSCLGGVLFIDEVYSFGIGRGGKDSFSKEAIDTLCGFLSDNAGKMICIIAGYEKDVEECFLSINKGLKSRFQWRHKLESLKNDELSLIFKLHVGKIGWKVEDDALEAIESNADIFQEGQGRTLKNLIFKSKMMHASRLIKCDGKKGVLNKDDVLHAIQWMQKGKKEKHENFGLMYA
jgi:SpoVK/Ycf46/Vps4 family AAA+-type ATPase